VGPGSKSGKKTPVPVIVAVALACVILVVLGISLGQFGGNNSGGGAPSAARPTPVFEPEPEPLPDPMPTPVMEITPIPEPEPIAEPEAPEQEEQPTPEPMPVFTPTEQVWNAVYETDHFVRVAIGWLNGQSTVFERDLYSSVWTMQSRDGNYRIVDPSFAYDGDAIMIGFPTTNSRYHLFNDHSGYFGNEALTWELLTGAGISRDSVSGVNQTHDLVGALSRYPLLLIRIRWHDGTTTDFYRQEDLTWRMNGRNGGFTAVNPGFSGSGGLLYVSIPASSNEYVLFDDGTGSYGNEGFWWSYNYISH